jgi:hypothetical protein
MSFAPTVKNPYIQLKDRSGAIYRFDTLNERGQPALLNLSPDEPFSQINVVGDTATIADKRTSQIVPVDLSMGASLREYKNTEGITQFLQSDCDTRFEGVVVCRPARTALAGNIGATNAHWRIVYTGKAGALYHGIAANGTTSKYHSGAAWVNFAGLGGANVGHVQALGYIYTLDVTSRRLFRSADGINFAAVGAAIVAAGTVYDIAFFDNKIWALVYDSGTFTLGLYSFTDAAAAAPANAVLVSSFSFNSLTEAPMHLVVWKDAAGGRCLFAVTSRQVLMYNAVGNVFEPYEDFAENNPSSMNGAWSLGVHALVFKSTNDLYLSHGKDADYLMRYSPGAGFGKVGWNAGGGLDANRQGHVQMLAQNSYGLAVWVRGSTTVGGATTCGGVWWMNPSGGWHCINRDLGGTKTIAGGGIANSLLFTVYSDGTVEHQPFPNTGAHPQHAVTHDFDANVDLVLHYSKTNGGIELARKNLLGFTLHTLGSDGDDEFGLDNGTSVKIEYRLDGGAWVTVTQYIDTNGAIQTLVGSVVAGSDFANSSFPLRLIVGTNGLGVLWYEMEWRVTLRTTNPIKTPVLVTCAPRFLKVLPPHYTFDCVVDLSLMGNFDFPMGKGAAAVHKTLKALDHTGYMFELSYGGVDWAAPEVIRSVEFAMAPQIMPHLGFGRYRLVLRDVSQDPSGTNGA